MSGIQPQGSGANGAADKANEQLGENSLPPAYNRQLRTVCHRVKNDFQTISNLMALAQSFASTPTQLVASMEGRIGALSVAYSLFDRTGRPPTLRDLAREVVERAMSFTGKVFSVSYDLQETPLSPRLCSSFSLWLHEIVVNSLRHADQGDYYGALFLESNLSSTLFSLYVKDNGPGLPQGFNVEIHGHLGLKMAGALARHDLAGNMELASRHSGLAVCLSFSRAEFDSLNRESWS